MNIDVTRYSGLQGSLCDFSRIKKLPLGNGKSCQQVAEDAGEPYTKTDPCGENRP